MERGSEGEAFPQTLEPILLGFADLVAMIIQDGFPIVAFNRKHLGKDGLKTDVLPAGRWKFRLQKLPIRIDLHFDQVRGSNDFLDLTEVNTFRRSRWHLDL